MRIINTNTVSILCGETKSLLSELCVAHHFICRAFLHDPERDLLSLSQIITCSDCVSECACACVCAQQYCATILKMPPKRYTFEFLVNGIMFHLKLTLFFQTKRDD